MYLISGTSEVMPIDYISYAYSVLTAVWLELPLGYFDLLWILSIICPQNYNKST